MANRSNYAKVCPSHITDGLFVPSRSKAGKTDIRRLFDDGEIHFMGFDQLSCFDQCILLAVCARTGIKGIVVKGNENDITGENTPLRLPMLDMEKKDAATELKHTVTRVTAYSLLEDIGDTGKGGLKYKHLIDSLKRLSNITVYRCKNGRGGSMSLLNFEHDENKNLVISLNWRLADAILGKCQNIQVSLHERRQLKSKVAKILHAWLCSNVRLGHKLMNGQGASYERLCVHVWGEAYNELSKTNKRNKISMIKQALTEIGELDKWEVSKYKNKAVVTRPKEIPFEEDVVGTPGEIAEMIRKEKPD